MKARTTTPKEKESKYKLDFDFVDKAETAFMLMADVYSNEERKKRLGVLFAPMLYNTGGFQASMIIIHALSYMADLKHHSDHEFNAMIENRDIEKSFFETFDDMSVTDVHLFVNVIETYAKKLKRPNGGYGVTLEEWGRFLPKNQKEAKFVVQLLCDGGINKYDLTCAGLTANLLVDNLGNYGLRDESDEKNTAEGENLEN